MSKRIAGLTSSLLLAVGIAAFTGSALAGDGHGNGNGTQVAGSAPTVSATASASQSPGNSENAPGQLKKGSITSSASS